MSKAEFHWAINRRLEFDNNKRSTICKNTKQTKDILQAKCSSAAFTQLKQQPHQHAGVLCLSSDAAARRVSVNGRRKPKHFPLAWKWGLKIAAGGQRSSQFGLLAPWKALVSFDTACLENRQKDLKVKLFFFFAPPYFHRCRVKALALAQPCSIHWFNGGSINCWSRNRSQMCISLQWMWVYVGCFCFCFTFYSFD